MQAVREIVNSNVLQNIFDLPKALRNRTVEVLILPISDQPTPTVTFKPEEYAGVLKLEDATATAQSIREEWDRC